MNDDLISRSALLEEFDWVNRATAGEGNYEEDLRLLVKRVAEMPAEDAEIVRHGRWIQSKSVPAYHGCSHCHAAHKMHESCNTYVLLNYCPNCGAKMDAEVEG